MQSKFHSGNRKMRNTRMFKARVGVCCVFAGPEVRCGRIPAALNDPGDADIWSQPEVKRMPCFRRSPNSQRYFNHICVRIFVLTGAPMISIC